MNAPDNTEFNLWFEYDLFCQVNMWFVISIINSLSIQKKVYAVYTSYLDRTSKQFWNGFGPANASELKICYADRTPLNDIDLQLGQDLWTAYKSGNLEELVRLANNRSSAFPYLQEVVKAHVDRFQKTGQKEDLKKLLKTSQRMFLPTFIKCLQSFGTGKVFMALVIFN